MRTEDLECLIMINDCGSISSAAKKMYMSQPQLSQRVRKLESDFGVEIFNRSTYPIQLTYAGKQILQAAISIQHTLETLDSVIGEVKTETRGQMIIGVSSYRSDILTHIIPKYRKQYPHVEISINEHTPTSFTQLLLDRDIDIALLCVDDGYKESDIEYTFLDNDRMILFSGRDTNIAKKRNTGETIHFYDVADEMFVMPQRPFGFRKTIDRLFSSQKIDPKVMMTAQSTELSCRLAIACNCVSLCTETCIDGLIDLKNKGCWFRISDEDYNRALYIAHRKNMYLPIFMRDFISLVCEQFSKSKS